MKPAPFEYCRPETLDEAVALLSEFGDDALVMAGGLSLGALLNMRMVRPEAVIDINGLSGLDTIEVVGDKSGQVRLHDRRMRLRRRFARRRYLS